MIIVMIMIVMNSIQNQASKRTSVYCTQPCMVCILANEHSISAYYGKIRCQPSVVGEYFIMNVSLSLRRREMAQRPAEWLHEPPLEHLQRGCGADSQGCQCQFLRGKFFISGDDSCCSCSCRISDNNNDILTGSDVVRVLSLFLAVIIAVALVQVQVLQLLLVLMLVLVLIVVLVLVVSLLEYSCDLIIDL